MARIALVCEPPDGGVAEQVVQLALGLRAHGHEPLVLAPAGFAGAERLSAAGVGWHALPFRRGYGRPHRDLAALVRLVRLLRAQDAEVVHAHAAKAGVLGRLAALVTRRPAVYTPHCFPFVGDVSRRRRWFGVVMERLLAPATAAIVCVCEQERRLALEHRVAGPARLVVIHNGCPECDARAGVDPALARLREGGPVVGAVTVLRRQKRLDVLLRAAPAILAAVPEARVVIVGDGPERPALERVAAGLGLDGDERFALLPYAGPASRHLRGLDLYILPSAWEAFPIGVLEAQACAVPQVVTDVGGNGEAVVEATGRLVPPGDATALAEAVVALLRDEPARRAMGTASRERHAALFTVEQMVAATAGLYHRVVRR